MILDRRKFLKHEYDNYSRPAISLEGSKENEKDVDLPLLVFKWMDHTLADLSSEEHRQNDALLKVILEASLGSLAALYKENLVHTGMAVCSTYLSTDQI